MAKYSILLATSTPRPLLNLIGYSWQDCALCLLLAIGVDFLKAKRTGWVVYGVLAVYTVINVPVSIALSSPLTLSLLKATRGALADSIFYYVTAINIARIVALTALIIALPFLLRKILAKIEKRWVLGLLFLSVIVGFLVSRNTETRGLERNAVLVLLTSGFPRTLRNTYPDVNFRQSVLPGSSVKLEDLSRYRGKMKRKNVLVIGLESTAASYLKLYGASGEDVAPVLSELARTGFVVENAYAVYPESIKGLYSVLCSTYPALDTTAEQYQRMLIPSFVRKLKETGYRTALFHSGRFDYLGMQSVIENQGFDLMVDASQIVDSDSQSFGIRDERITVKRLLSWIETVPKHQPYFAYFLPIAGHHPYFSPKPHRFPGDNDLADYRSSLFHSDLALGQLVSGLKQMDRFKDTLIIAYGDHGEAFNQHAGNTAHSLFVYEENIRVPLLFSNPEFEPTRIDTLANLIDLAPTALELLGLPEVTAYQGQSLLTARNQMALFFTDYSLALMGLRDRNWKFIYEYESKKPQLFDLFSDPNEEKNIAAQYPRLVEYYRRHLLRWTASQQGRVN